MAESFLYDTWPETGGTLPKISKGRGSVHGDHRPLMSEQIPGELWTELDSLSVAPQFWLN
jgi:hypothetical protein